jgi:tetratricopeptide (TPR) repeat protein
MNSSVTTDLDLANRISKSIGRAYKEAVEFSKVLPSHALVRFRDVLEEVCEKVAAAEGVVLGKAPIIQSIKTLFDASAIPFGLKDRLHKIRSLCNTGAHQARAAGDQATKEDLQKNHASLVEGAAEVRSLILSVFEYMDNKPHGRTGKIDYQLVTIESQEWKDVLYAAIVDADPDMQYKAGLWCEAEIDRRLISNKYPIVSDEFAAQQVLLQRLAATFFRSAFEFVPNVDASFRYASFVNRGIIDGDKTKEALALIEAAANFGHGEACQLYGGILYDDDANYEEALKYFLLAEQNNDSRAYFCLWSYYTQGKACESQVEKALEYVKKGVELNCRDSLYALGRAYFEGDFVPKDVEKAKALLQKSADLGNGQALGFMKIYVDIGMDKFVSDFQEYALEVLARIPATPKAIVRSTNTYDPCPCNSGKKFKFCCMHKKIVEEKPQRIRFF